MKLGDYNIACDDFQKWQERMGEALSSATAFEIHCWNEEHGHSGAGDAAFSGLALGFSLAM